MNEKKDFWLSIIGLIVILAGAIVLILIDFPTGLLLILPSVIPHIIKLNSLSRGHKNEKC
ncbi:MAG: hypothetical protein IJF15_06515 [Oscillospiraceae bacterium]|nr:hypothetical protein [Oscillospiraceae bacterium]